MLHDIFLTAHWKKINAGISDYSVGIFLTDNLKILILKRKSSNVVFLPTLEYKIL